MEGNELLTSLGLADLVPRFDELMVLGSPHYKYADSTRNGVGIIEVSATAFDVTFLAINNAVAESFDGEIERIQLQTPVGTKEVMNVE